MILAILAIMSIKGDFTKRTTLENCCSINILRIAKDALASDPRMAPAASRCLCPATAYD
jgi:hypothetical protein